MRKDEESMQFENRESQPDHELDAAIIRELRQLQSRSYRTRSSISLM